MPNTIAYLMLMVWPITCIILFHRMPLERAIIWSILGGYLILPPVAEFDLPLVPSMNKHSIASLSAFAICVFVMGRRVGLIPRPPIARLLLAVFVLGVVPTVLTNRDPIIFSSVQNAAPIDFTSFALPGLSLRDTLSVMIGQILVLLPFLLARQFLGTERGLRELVVGFALGGLIYSIPAVMEILLGPVLNIYIYGFFQHDFSQMIRDGGYRPIVFLQHGLWLAFLILTTLVAAAALARNSRDRARMHWTMATVYLALVLNACKSLASITYGLVLAPLVLFLGKRTQIAVALLMATVAVTYPMLRNGGAIPTDAIVERVAAFNPDRAQSLEFRFHNEEVLLERAHERPAFGWGGWGRNLVLDPVSGAQLTVPDGEWIITFGTFGWVGYIGQMGLLAIPLLLLRLQGNRQSDADLSPLVATVAVILSITMIDMLLNATLTNLTWMCSGAILGYYERLRYPVEFEPAPANRRPAPIIGAPPPKGKRSVL